MLKEIDFSGTHCFAPNASIGGLAKINYVFGPNGSGKTTISNRLARIGSGDAKADQIVRWEQTARNTRVYNRDYVRRAFTSVDGEEPGVFLLGKDEGEAYKVIKKLEADKAKADRKAGAAQARLDQCLDDLTQLRSDLADRVWKKRSAIPNDLQIHMPGLRGKKEQCLDKVLNAAEANPVRGDQSLDDLSKKVEAAFDETVKTRNEFPSPLSMEWDEGALATLLATPIVGSADLPLTELIERLGHSDWVHQGMKYLNAAENEESLCPFCQQKSPEMLVNQLENIFDETYAEKQAEVLAFHGVITREMSAIQIYKDSHFHALSSEIGEDEVAGVFRALLSNLASVRKAVEEKMLLPSDKVQVSPVQEDYQALEAVVANANKEIRATNAIISDRQSQRTAIVKEAWREFAHGHLGDLLGSFKKQRAYIEKIVDGQGRTIQKQQAFSDGFEAQLKTLRGKVISSETTIEDINRLLEICQFHSFKLDVAKGKKDGYRIVRDDGMPADIESLSEGERTFVTFLYYYHSLSEVKQRDESDKLLAVIDDPISSLDGDIMFVLSALIRMLLEGVKNGEHDRVEQVILLTHNTRFHNEVSYQHNGETSPSVKFYRIRKYSPEPNVIEDCGQRNPIRTAYQELWDEVQAANLYQTKQMPWLPNVMRRILESYFTTLGGQKNLYDIGASLPPADRALHFALIAWSHSGSHTIMDDEVFAQNSAPSGRWLNAFKRVFEHAGGGVHLGHYTMMMERAQTYAV